MAINGVLLKLIGAVIVALINSLILWAALKYSKRFVKIKEDTYHDALAVSVYFGLAAFVLSFLNIGYFSTVILLALMFFILQKYHSVKDVWKLWLVWLVLYLVVLLILTLASYSAGNLAFPGL